MTAAGKISERGSVIPFGRRDQDVEPPVNHEAEQALLSAVLGNNKAFDPVSLIVTADDFSDPAHARLFQACEALIQRGQTANAVTLKNHFERDEGLSDVGGMAYLARLQTLGVAPALAPEYARQVRDLALRRRTMEEAAELYLAAATVELDQDAGQIVDRGANVFAELGLAAAGARGQGVVTIAEAARSMRDRVEDAMRRRATGEQAGLSFGLGALDRITGGLKAGHLVVIGARPSIGKTSLAEAIAWRNAEHGKRVLFSSLEMPADELIQREAARRTGIPADRLGRGDISDAEYDAIFAASRDLEQLPILFHDQNNQRLGPILAQARFAQRRGGLDLLVIDYLQLMQGDGRRGERRDLELGQITQALKAFAKQARIPVVLLSQLNRGSESRENRRPQLYDLRESGSIEQDADIVLLLHREEFYLEKEEPVQRANQTAEKHNEAVLHWQEALARARGRGEINIAKWRGGGTRLVQVGWEGAFLRYHDLDEGRRPEQEAFL